MKARLPIHSDVVHGGQQRRLVDSINSIDQSTTTDLDPVDLIGLIDLLGPILFVL